MKQIVLCAVLLAPVPAAAQVVSIDFQDSLPFTATGGGQSRDLLELGNPGSCAPRVFWNRQRVAPGTSGGWNNRGYVRYTWCDWKVSQAGDDSEQAGFTEQGYRFAPSGTATPGTYAWPDTIYGRMRIYIEQPIIWHPTGDDDHQLKFFIWHTGVFDGSHRVMAFLQSGANCGGTDTGQVCFSIQRNINHNTDAANVAIPVGQWVHLQFAWRHGPVGTSWVKVWRDNNQFNSPTAQDLNLNANGAWLKDNRGYDGQFYLANAANNGTRFDRDFVYRLMDFQLDTQFDASWAPDGSGSSTSGSLAAPQNLRLVSQ